MTEHGSDVEHSSARLVRDLYGYAQRFAQEAAAHLAEQRHDDCIAKAGIALEYIAKAYLVNEHPLLIVPAPSGRLDLDGMRWAVGQQPLDTSRSRTITATEAVRRCCALVPGLDEGSLKLVLAARNGILHLGQTGHDVTTVISAVAAAADQLLPGIHQDPRSMWGYYFDAVRGRRDEERSQIDTSVADRIARTRDHWEVTLKRLGAEATGALIDAASQHPLADDEQLGECPICQGPAVLTGSFEVEEEPEYDVDDGHTYVSSVSLIPYFEPHALNCRACGFWLRGVPELDAAGIDTDRRIAGIDIDPGDYYGDYEP